VKHPQPKKKPDEDDETPPATTLATVEPEKPAKPAPAKKSDSITVTYVGDPKDGSGPSNSTFAGVLMPKDKPVVIENAAWIEKFGFRFRRNKHFHVE
jgi:hypothetical protein